MADSTLDKNFHHLIPFEMVFNSVHMDGYDPITVIQEFWNKYYMNDHRDHLVCLYLKSIGVDIDDPVKDLDEKELHKFSIELLHVLLAYYIVHMHKISVDDLEFPKPPTSKITEEELKFRQINNLLFGPK